MRFSRSRMAVRTLVRGTGAAQRALMTEQTRRAEPHGRGGGERDGGGEAAALGEEDLGQEQDEEGGGAAEADDRPAYTVHVVVHQPSPSLRVRSCPPAVIHDRRPAAEGAAGGGQSPAGALRDRLVLLSGSHAPGPLVRLFSPASVSLHRRSPPRPLTSPPSRSTVWPCAPTRLPTTSPKPSACSAPRAVSRGPRTAVPPGRRPSGARRGACPREHALRRTAGLHRFPRREPAPGQGAQGVQPVGVRPRGGGPRDHRRHPRRRSARRGTVGDRRGDARGARRAGGGPRLLLDRADAPPGAGRGSPVRHRVAAHRTAPGAQADGRRP